MQCGAHVKDMYIIPLLSNESVPTQILPFDGPGIANQYISNINFIALFLSLSLHSSLQGLPFNRHDMFLCVIIRAKNVPVATDTPRKRKYSGHARSAESPDIQPHPEKKHQVREREREKMEERGRERNRKQRERECIELLFFYRLKLVLEEPLPPPLPLLPLKYPFTETQKILTRSLQLKFPKEQQQQKLNQMQLQLLV